MELIGTLRITRVEEPRANKPSVYAVRYAPGEGGGGELQMHYCAGEEQLTHVLAEMGIAREVIERALEDLRQEGRASIPNVRSSHQQLDRFGLHSNISTAILEYLKALTRTK